MQYFETFPKLFYDVDGTGDYKIVTDILRRFKARKSITDQIVFFDKYEVKDGEKPEQVSHKFYGSTDYHWVVLSINNISDRYYDWPLSFQDFEAFVKDKYSNPDGIHHYEVTRSSGKSTGNGPDDYSHKIEVNSDATGAQSVSNREFEQRLQDRKRLIKLLNPAYLNTFIQEFNNLVRN